MTVSVAYPAPKVRGMVVDELRAAFVRTAKRGEARLSLQQRLKETAREQGMAVATRAPATAPPTQRTVSRAAPIARPAGRAVMSGMEDTMRTRVQLGQAIQPTMRARLLPYVTQRRVAQPGVALTPRIGTAPVGGWPTVQESDEADWTTYALGGAAILGVFGLVYYLKKTKRI